MPKPQHILELLTRHARLPGMARAAATGGIAFLPKPVVNSMVGFEALGASSLRGGMAQWRLLAAVGSHEKITASSAGRALRLGKKLGASDTEMESLRFLTREPKSPEDLQIARHSHSRLRNVNRWSKMTGMQPVAVSEDLAPDQAARIIRHESIHTTHFSNTENPAIRGFVESSPTLEEIIKTKYPNNAELVLQNYREQFDRVYKWSPDTAQTLYESERLAQSQEANPIILRQMEEAGLTTPEKATRDLSLRLRRISEMKFRSKSAANLAPARSEAEIPGLRPLGISPAIRKKTTDFGSGWQGTPKMTDPARFLKLIGANEESIKATDLQQGRYQAGELEDLVKAWKSGGKVEPVEIFIDEAKNIIGAQGRHRALAAMKAGVQEIPYHIRKGMMTSANEVGKAMLEVSKGAAIGNAGTSKVPAMIKRTARVIKNAL